MSLFSDDPNTDGVAHPNKKLDNLIRLAEMCVDQLQQNEEHYAEVSYPQFCDTFEYEFVWIFSSNDTVEGFRHFVFGRVNIN